MRAFKTVNDSYIEPISFVVPRRAEVFQSDIYPPTTGSKPAMSAAEWFDGKDGIPPKLDLESVYSGKEPTEVPGSYKPAAIPTPTQPTSPKVPSPTKKEPELPKETASSSIASRGPPPSMKAQQGSIAALASKFADNDNGGSEEEEDDSSSFEEVSKPVDRTQRTAPVATNVAMTAASPTLPKAAEGVDQSTSKTNTGQNAVQATQSTPSQVSKKEVVPDEAKVSSAVNFYLQCHSINFKRPGSHLSLVQQANHISHLAHHRFIYLESRFKAISTTSNRC